MNHRPFCGATTDLAAPRVLHRFPELGPVRVCTDDDGSTRRSARRFVRAVGRYAAAPRHEQRK